MVMQQTILTETGSFSESGFRWLRSELSVGPAGQPRHAKSIRRKKLVVRDCCLLRPEFEQKEEPAKTD